VGEKKGNAVTNRKPWEAGSIGMKTCGQSIRQKNGGKYNEKNSKPGGRPNI